nr:hypothetical protein Q903MT_gene2407 [Picea sitchensis]
MCAHKFIYRGIAFPRKPIPYLSLESFIEGYSASIYGWGAAAFSALLIPIDNAPPPVNQRTVEEVILHLQDFIDLICSKKPSTEVRFRL